MSGWLCLVRHQTHLGKAWGSGSLLFSILAKTKESDKWGRRAVKICWLSLAVRDTPRVTWWLRVVSLAFMICCHWLTCSKRTVLAARSKPVVLMRYAAHRIPGLPYRQSWTCAAAMKYCRKPRASQRNQASSGTRTWYWSTGRIAGDADRW